MSNADEKRCPLCGSRETEYYFTERGHDLVACENCELFFIDPYPGDTEEVHERVSKYKYEKLKVATPETHYSAAKRYYKRYYPLVEEELANASFILDIGCGTGRLLELLGQNYPNDKLLRIGIELNTERAAFARQTAQCDIYETPVEKFTYPEKFDVITMINVLSHIASFDNLFNAVGSLLAPNGKLILKVGEYTKKIKKNSVFDWGIPDHLHILGMNTLAYMCRKYGFKELRHQCLPLSEDLFSKDKWKAPGRSRIRNIIKRMVVITPFALSILKKLYEIRFGKAIYTSFIVLTPGEGERQQG